MKTHLSYETLIYKQYYPIVISFHNNKVILSDVQQDKGEKTVNEFKEEIRNSNIAFVQSDVRSEESVRGNIII